MLQILKRYEKEGLLYSQKHPKLPLSIWNYTDKVQYDSLWDEVTLMCRGLVIDNNTEEIVAKPFKKFFNLSENKTEITNEFEVFDKMDGSLIIVFCYKENWVFASRGSFTSPQCLKSIEMLKNTLIQCPLHDGYTYMFETIYKENRIVVDYKDYEDLVMLGAIHTITGKETPYQNLVYLFGKHYTIVKKYNYVADYKKLKDLIKRNEEGFVVRFSNGERIKIKGDEYVRLHKIMTNISTISIWECLKNNQDLMVLIKDVPDEFYFKVKEINKDILYKFNSLKTEIKAEYKVINMSLGNCNNKTFASFVKGNKYESFLFSLRNNKDIDKLIWKNIKPKYKKI